jgi:hypothetical protein
MRGTMTAGEARCRIKTEPTRCCRQPEDKWLGLYVRGDCVINVTSAGATRQHNGTCYPVRFDPFLKNCRFGFYERMNNPCDRLWQDGGTIVEMLTAWD